MRLACTSGSGGWRRSRIHKFYIATICMSLVIALQTGPALHPYILVSNFNYYITLANSEIHQPLVNLRWGAQQIKIMPPNRAIRASGLVVLQLQHLLGPRFITFTSFVRLWCTWFITVPWPGSSCALVSGFWIRWRGTTLVKRGNRLAIPSCDHRSLIIKIFAAGFCR